MLTSVALRRRRQIRRPRLTSSKHYRRGRPRSRNRDGGHRLAVDLRDDVAPAQTCLRGCRSSAIRVSRRHHEHHGPVAVPAAHRASIRSTETPSSGLAPPRSAPVSSSSSAGPPRFGSVPSVTVNVVAPSGRCTVSFTAYPEASARSAAAEPPNPTTGSPLTAVTTSPAWSPPFSAGLPGSMLVIAAPVAFCSLNARAAQA